MWWMFVTVVEYNDVLPPRSERAVSLFRGMGLAPRRPVPVPALEPAGPRCSPTGVSGCDTSSHLGSTPGR